MVEILRRVVLVVGVYGTLVAVFYARPAVVEVAVEDFAARQRDRPRWTGDRDKPIEDFVAERTRDRTFDAGGPAWEALYEALGRLKRGEAPVGRFSGRGGRDWAVGRVYLLPDDPPLPALVPALSAERPFVYARLARPDGVVWLAMTRRIGREADGAPADLVRPLQRWWWAFLLGGVLLYALLPRRRRGPDTLAYSTVRAGILPDVMGLLLGGTFFALSLLVVPQITGTGALIDPAAWPLYLILAIFVALAWVIHGWAAWYEAFRLDLDDKGLRLQTLFGDRRVAFNDVRVARLEVRRAPKLLRQLLWVAALFNPRAAGQALLLSSRADPELVLVERGGARVRLRLTALEGTERVAAALEAAGVEVEDATLP